MSVSMQITFIKCVNVSIIHTVEVRSWRGPRHLLNHKTTQHVNLDDAWALTIINFHSHLRLATTTPPPLLPQHDIANAAITPSLLHQLLLQRLPSNIPPRRYPALHNPRPSFHHGAQRAFSEAGYQREESGAIWGDLPPYSTALWRNAMHYMCPPPGNIAQ